MRGFCGVLCLLSLALVSNQAIAGHDDRVGHGDVVVNEGEQVGDAVAFGGSLTVRGWVQGDAVAMGGDVHLLSGARVDGDITSLGGSVIVDPGSVALGSRVGMGPQGISTIQQNTALRPQAPPIAPVGFTSDVRRQSWSDRFHDELHSGLNGAIQKVGHMLGLFGLLVVLGVIMLGAAPLRTRAMAAAVAAHPGKSLSLGVLVALVSLVAILVLSITIIGIPVAAALAVVVSCAAVLGLTGVSILVGELLPLPGLRDRQFFKLLLGAGVLVTALALPYVGGVIGVVATFFGLGSLAVTRLRPGHDVFGVSSPLRTKPS